MIAWISDVPIGGVGVSRSPNIFRDARKLVKSGPRCKRDGGSILRDTVGGQ